MIKPSDHPMGDNWQHWLQLTQQGNVGQEIALNPALYPLIEELIEEQLKQQRKEITLLDLGAGTASLAHDILEQDISNSLGLRLCKNVSEMRARVDRFYSLEGEISYIGQSRIDNSRHEPIVANLEHQAYIPFNNGSVDIAISRQFLMHLSAAGLDHHFHEVSRVLSDTGIYVFTVLHPDYEGKKHAEKYPDAPDICEGQKYRYPHGNPGETEALWQYHIPIEYYQAAIKNAGLSLKFMQPIFSQIPGFEKSHARYYSRSNPMSLLFLLRKQA